MPMTSTISEADFAILAKETGLPLSPAQIETLRSVYPMLRGMMDSVSAPMPREAEPGLIFLPEVR